MIGAVGGSLTRMPIRGRNHLSGKASPFWPDRYFDEYGGGDLERWGGPWWSSVTRAYWRRFRRGVNEMGADIVWLHIICRNHDPETEDWQWKYAKRVVKRIRRIATGAVIHASRMPLYDPPNLCPKVGRWGPSAAHEIADRLVFEQLVEYYGPIVSPITLKSNNGPEDPCHAGAGLVVAQGLDLEIYGW